MKKTFAILALVLTTVCMLPDSPKFAARTAAQPTQQSPVKVNETPVWNAFARKGIETDFGTTVFENGGITYFQNGIKYRFTL